MASLIFIAAGLGCEKGVVKRPFPEVVEVTAYDGARGFDYRAWVECTIRNSGADGSVKGYWPNCGTSEQAEDFGRSARPCSWSETVRRG